MTLLGALNVKHNGCFKILILLDLFAICDKINHSFLLEASMTPHSLALLVPWMVPSLAPLWARRLPSALEKLPFTGFCPPPTFFLTPHAP